MPERAMKPSAGLGFSENLFWDVDPETLDLKRHTKYIVTRVLEAGTLEDWFLLCRTLTLERIIETAQSIRTLDRKALAFLSVVGHVPLDTFRCYTSKPSIQTHWTS